MPFLRPHKISRAQRLENSSMKSGLRSTIYDVNGCRYIGEWKDNKRHGKGRILLKSHILYEGDWKNNLPSGFGVQGCPSPNNRYHFLSYRGHFKDGKRHNGGTYHRNDGSYYAGDWKNGKRHGYGLLWYADGTFYAGYFYEGHCEGQGMFVRTDGNRYDGEWKAGKKNGRGRFFHLDKGQLQKGIWVDDVCVFSVLENIPFRQLAMTPTAYPLTQITLSDVENFCEDFKEKLLKGGGNSCVSIRTMTQDEDLKVGD